MNIEKLSIDTLLTSTSLEKLKLEKKRSFFRRFTGGRVKYIAGFILILLAFAFIVMYFKPFSGQDSIIDYKQYPFLKMTSSSDPALEWDVFVDNKNSQVFLVKNLPSSYRDSSNSRRGRRMLIEKETTGNLTENLTDDTPEANYEIFTVVQQGFNDDYFKLYTLFEGDFDHLHCFRLEADPNSQLMPLLKTSLFSEKKTSVGEIDEFEANPSEVGPSVEIHTDLDGKLIAFRLKNATRQMNDTSKIQETASVDFKVAEPFDIYNLKMKLSESDECFDYSTKFNAPDSDYDNSKMKLFWNKDADKANEILNNEKNRAKDEMHDMKNKAKDKYHDAKDKAKDKYHDAKDKAKDLKDDADDELHDKKNKAKDELNDKKNKAKDELRDKQKKAKDKLKDAKDKAKEMTKDAKEKVKTNRINNNSNEAQDEMDDRRKEAKEFKEKFDEMQKKGKDMERACKNIFKRNDAKDKNNEMQKIGQDFEIEMSGNIKLAGSLKEDLKDVKNDLKDKFHDAKNDAKDKMHDMKNNAKDGKPLLSNRKVRQADYGGGDFGGDSDNLGDYDLDYYNDNEDLKKPDEDLKKPDEDDAIEIAGNKIRDASLKDDAKNLKNDLKDKMHEKKNEAKDKLHDGKNQINKKYQRAEIPVHGNWCGAHRGGLDNNCKTLCKEDLWVPTENCTKCSPTIDYVDKLCMFHDMCVVRENMEIFGKNWTTSSDKMKVSYECNSQLANELEKKKLKSRCEDAKDCVKTGKKIAKAIRESSCTCEMRKKLLLPKINLVSGDLEIEEKSLQYEAYLPTGVCKAL